MCDESDYDRVIRPIERQMMSAIWRILRHADDADDAFQDALERIWKRRQRVCSHPNSKALVLRICNQTAYDLLRRRMRREHETHLAEQLAVTADGAPTPADQLSRQEERQKLLDEIGRLPGNQAVAVLMRLVDQVSYEDIAAALGCTQATARTHVKRGRQRLQTQLLQHNDLDQKESSHDKR